jgi:hypothetical protein
MKISTKLSPEQLEEAKGLDRRQDLFDEDNRYLEEVRNKYTDPSRRNYARWNAVNENKTPHDVLLEEGFNPYSQGSRYYSDLAKVLQDARTEHIDYLTKHDYEGTGRADKYLETMRNRAKRNK